MGSSGPLGVCLFAAFFFLFRLLTEYHVCSGVARSFTVAVSGALGNITVAVGDVSHAVVL